MIQNINFETSVFFPDKIISTTLPQIVLVGKSNVGKSSFINSISNRKNLAKVGQTPGKTKCLNYYLVNNSFYIVDLPGYGYSRMSLSEKKYTSDLVNKYICGHYNIKHILFLVDIRHKPTNDDRIMYEWLLEQQIPFTIIATKADKIAKSKLEIYIKEISKGLFSKEDIIPFSSNNRLNIDIIEKTILDSVINND